MRTWRLLPALLAGSVGLAACSSSNSNGNGGTGPNPPGGGPAPVATVQVTLPSGLLIGDTATAVVVLRDAQGNVLTGRAITFNSSGGVATVSASGLVTAVSAGGPVTISATSEGRTGNAQVTVRDDTRFGYVWANSGTTANYTPNHSYVFNSSGGAVNITRTNGGAYTVRFVGLGAQPGQRENVQVTAYGGLYYCSVAGWQTDGADLVVTVRCFAPPDTPQDALYTVMVTGARALGGRVGFAHANDPAAASYTPAKAYNSAGGAVTVARNSVGTYRATFTGLGRGTTGGPEQVMVTQHGSGMDRCVVASWNETAFHANISCTTRTGAPVDAQFSILMVERGRQGQRAAFAWAHDPGAAQYTPHTGYSHNSAGGAITARRTGTGEYSVTFDGLVKGTGTETVLVSAYGAVDRFCRTASWGMVSATEFRVYVNCYDPSGSLADSRYDIIVLQ